MNRNQARIPVDQLTPGDRVTQVFLVAARELRQTKAGKPFIQATLQDGTAEYQPLVQHGPWGRLSEPMYDPADIFIVDDDVILILNLNPSDP